MTVATDDTGQALGDKRAPGAVVYPTRKDEGWRYAPHQDLRRLVFGPPPSEIAEIPAELEARIPDVGGPVIVVVNGRVDRSRSDLDRLPAGLHIRSLADVLDDPPDAVATHLQSAGAGPVDAFEALGRIHGRDGAYIHLEENANLDQPIQLVDISIPARASDATCTGVVVHLSDGSEATMVETHLGAGTSFGGSTTRTSVTMGARSSLTHLVLQDAPAEQIQLSRIEVVQMGESEYRGRSFNLGASYGRIDYQVRLIEEEATADLSGLYFGSGNQTLDQQVNIIHHAGNCTSRQRFRGVLDGQSTGVFSGGIAVSPGANGTDAEQTNHNLLLSTRAEVNSQPRLEILADEVACAHGATVGQLDEDALYYLRSRGVPADEARSLLIAGFADQTVDEVEIENLRTWVIARLGHGHA
ncbi:MAG: Fe-S cluster assembly protein SufD [Acidimicrobiia bacterium]|nr:Fe-S cluster assembly protein SufD [Acidimicrobiia bacterium]